MIERYAVTRFGRRGHDHVVGLSQLREIGAGAERRWLSRADNHTLHVAFVQPLAENAEFGDGRVGEHVHGPARHVENEVQNTVFSPFGPEFLQVSQHRHGIPPRETQAI